MDVSAVRLGLPFIHSLSDTISILSSVPMEANYCLVLDLKDTFFCVPCILAVRPYLPWKIQLEGRTSPLDSPTLGIQRQPLSIWIGISLGPHELAKPPCDLTPVC